MTPDEVHKQLVLYQSETNNRLQAGNERFKQNEALMGELHNKVNNIHEDTRTIRSVMEAAQGFFRTIDWVSKKIKPIAVIIVSIVAMGVSAYHGIGELIKSIFKVSH